MDLPAIPPSLLEIHQYSGTGFQPLVDYGAWRVALLNAASLEQVVEFQRHNETDEVFVLLQGRCLLFLGEGGEQVTQIYARDMLPFHLYNVRRGAWHAHCLTPDAKVLIVENCDTSPANSPRLPLTGGQRRDIDALIRQAWGNEVPAPRHP